MYLAYCAPTITQFLRHLSNNGFSYNSTIKAKKTGIEHRSVCFTVAFTTHCQ